MLTKRLIGLLIVAANISAVGAQQIIKVPDSYPVIGKRCPDFKLRNIKYYKQQEAMISAFKGKWLVLDFFTSHCGGCIASFPKVNEEAKAAGGKLVYMMVGAPDEPTQTLYTGFRKKMNLVMPCAFDHTLFEKWSVTAVPFVVVIDDKGIVRSMSDGVSNKELNDLMAGVQAAPAGESATVGTASPVMRYGSIIRLFDPSMEKMSMPRLAAERDGQLSLSCSGLDLGRLINFAFWGVDVPVSGRGTNAGKDPVCNEYAEYPLIETADSALFEYSAKEHSNLFDYRVSVPSGKYSVDDILRIMRQDIGRYFGWNIDVESIERRCWNLVATDSLKNAFRNRGMEADLKGSIPTMNFMAHKLDFNSLFNFIYSSLPKHTLLIDKTGILGDIDIAVNAHGPWTSIQDAQSELRKIGFDLEPASIQVKTIVVRDRTKGELAGSGEHPAGVRFEDRLSWQQALDKAKRENKSVFVFWRNGNPGENRLMDSSVFPAGIAGDFMNSRFVSLRYEIDGSPSGDAKMLLEKYHIKQSSALIFFSADGLPTHIIVGDTYAQPMSFINLVVQAAKPEAQYYTLLGRFSRGERDSVSTVNLYQMARAIDSAMARTIGRAYIRDIILARGGGSPLTTAEASLVASEYDAGDTLAEGYFVRNTDKIDSAFHDAHAVENIVIGRIFRKYTEMADHTAGKSPDWESAKQEMIKSCPGVEVGESLHNRQLYWYKDKKEWDKYGLVVGEVVDDLGAKAKADQLNEYAWDVFLHCDDPVLLQRAIGWIKTALQLSNNSPEILETYAELLYKTKSRENYLDIEGRLVPILRDPDMAANYQKMKKGLPTWED